MNFRLRNNHFIDLSTTKINPMEHYKVQLTKKKVLLATILASGSFIFPDASLGLMLSGVALSPLPFTKALKNKYLFVKEAIIKRYYQWK